MKLERRELADLMVELANERFGSGQFRRRELMNATEQEIRTRGFWTTADDVLSESADPKSRGLAEIDYCVSDLAKLGTIVSVQHSIWRLATPESPRQIYPEELPAEELEKLLEGAKKTVVINAYERNPKARKLCIEHWKPICTVCEFNFELIYGEIGAGFIHVHHIVPIAQIGKSYQIHPINDLRPVCPNCHAMLHTRNPPLSINKLRNIVDACKSTFNQPA